jgi:alkanesulfonate monooxygenase SsuD/methylene tetrahydromethanopterin reductase-like flavin-dependent oxidoreductase (luciferase family)
MLNIPQALSQPHPAVMIGGMGEKRTLRLVAQYADACNLFIYGGSDVIRHKLDVLRGHCEDVEGTTRRSNAQPLAPPTSPKTA